MTEQRSDLVLALARLLYVNGQTTDRSIAAAERLAAALGFKTSLMPRWGELLLRSEDSGEGRVSALAAAPAGVNMQRVIAAMRAVDEVEAGTLSAGALPGRLAAIERKPAAPLWVFTLAAGAGAVA